MKIFSFFMFCSGIHWILLLLLLFPFSIVQLLLVMATAVRVLVVVVVLTVVPAGEQALRNISGWLSLGICWKSLQPPPDFDVLASPSLHKPPSSPHH